MSRKDYRAIAAIVAELPHDDADLPANTTRGKTAQRFADYCATTNVHFDRARFLRACGV